MDKKYSLEDKFSKMGMKKDTTNIKPTEPTILKSNFEIDEKSTSPFRFWSNPTKDNYKIIVNIARKYITLCSSTLNFQNVKFQNVKFQNVKFQNVKFQKV